MELLHSDIERHYRRDDLLEGILDAVRESGKDPSGLAPSDLSPVDEFHTSGLAATVELAAWAPLRPGTRVLDVGCGLGGSARYLASEYGCHVTGVDVTQQYVTVGEALTELVGLDDRVAFRHADGLDLPFDDESFDVVWTEHVQMNVSDKAGFYAEIARVLKPGGQLRLYEVFAGEGGTPHYPVPWSEDGAISFLMTPAIMREMLESLGFTLREWEDISQQAHDNTVAAMQQAQATGPSPLGLHLLMGDNIGTKAANHVRNLEEHRITIVRAIAERTPA